MIRKITFIISCLVFILPNIASANELSEQQKIDALIAKVNSSNAVFVRNGSEHSATEAAAHIRKKCNYAGDRIKTARQFVDKLASRSYLTGNPYYVQFDNGTKKTTRYWLLLELTRLEDGYDAQNS